jgi:hypothetical protein
MASLISHPDKTHEATCFAAYQTWQQAVAGSPSQATQSAADRTYYRAVIASCRHAVFRQALRELGFWE